MSAGIDLYAARLDAMVRRFEEIERELASLGGTFDRERYTALVKERAALEPTVAAYAALLETSRQLEGSRRLVESDDVELRALAEEEIATLELRLEELAARVGELMLPKDPDDEKDIFVEIRAGAGGDEAGIFAGDLARMYLRYAEEQGMKTELVSESIGDAGGYKEIVFAVKGNAPYAHFKHESGVHRVQRVPATEAQGRIHTSTATVAVLPQVEDDVEVEIKAADLQIDTYKASGAGGQYVNKTESAIRITHVPTGIIVASQQERSQMQNRERAMQMLRAQLHERKRREREEATGTMRRSQVGTGDRSEKVRTYNIPQDRVTDHRINRSFGNLRGILDGDIAEIVAALRKDERARLLAGSSA
ncbi:MAG: peptide chain release factor 1 [Vulcanimicrobiaceae bacterium]